MCECARKKREIMRETESSTLNWDTDTSHPSQKKQILASPHTHPLHINLQFLRIFLNRNRKQRLIKLLRERKYRKFKFSQAINNEDESKDSRTWTRTYKTRHTKHTINKQELTCSIKLIYLFIYLNYLLNYWACKKTIDLKWTTKTSEESKQTREEKLLSMDEIARSKDVKMKKKTAFIFLCQQYITDSWNTQIIATTAWMNAQKI